MADSGILYKWGMSKGDRGFFSNVGLNGRGLLESRLNKAVTVQRKSADKENLNTTLSFLVLLSLDTGQVNKHIRPTWSLYDPISQVTSG